MKTKLIEMRQKRATLITNARALLDRAEGEKRDLTQEEQNNWDGMMKEANQLKGTIDREERMMEQEVDLGQSVTAATRPELDGRNGGGERIEFRSRSMRNADQEDPEWRTNPEWRRILRTGASSYRAGFRQFLRGLPISAEMRALQADLDTQGGYLMAPIQMVDRIIQAVDDAVFIRRLASVFAVPNADSLGVPTLDSDPADADWTSELATGGEDGSMSFGKRELKPHPLAKRIKLSRKLIMKVPNAEDLTVTRLGYKFGITQEKGFLTGNGSGQPLGVFTASPNGISTGRDVSSGNTTTSMAGDGLINAKYALKAQYWPRAQWLFHRDGVAQVAKLKDTTNQYLWQPGLQAGQPDRLLNFPVNMSEYAPNTFTTGLYTGILGDFSNYWIADSMAMEVQRLLELYAENNQIGLIGRLDTDGAPVLEEAFVRVKLT